jgi:hypothetical protein
MYKNYELFIRDFGLWDSAGEGESYWHIQIDGLPEDFVEQNDNVYGVFVIRLTDEETEQLGLEDEVRDSYQNAINVYGEDSPRTLEAKEIVVMLSDFIDNYDVPERVYKILENLPEG